MSIHLSLSAATESSARPERSAKKPKAATLKEEKCDYVGPADRVSNLRHIRFYVPPDETSLERQLREAHINTQQWNQAFWAEHNEKFKKIREEFIQTNLQEKYGSNTKGQKRLTADEMSKFYKSFLDKHLHIHAQYNKEWYKRNVRNLLLSARVWLERITNKNR